MILRVIVLFVVGLCLGSFVNALVWRLKTKRNWVSDRSICTHCKHRLAAVDLIPLLSWLYLRGRCRYCHKKIDDNPLVELLMGVLFSLSYLVWPLGFDGEGTLRFAVWLLALVLLVAMFLYDLKWMLLPNKLTFTLLGIGAVQLVVVWVIRDFDFGLIEQTALSVVLGGAVFHLIYVFSKGKYIGGGDVKLGYAYGLLLLDPLLSWLVITFASVIGSLVSGVMIFAGKAKLKSKLPFGPMLILGIIVAMLWGQKLWEFVNNLWL